LMKSIPLPALKRLGFSDTFGSPLDDWVRVLFHLAWNFPGRFAQGIVGRHRLLKLKWGDCQVQEEILQFERRDGQDVFSGVIFSRFPSELDLATATRYAIGLLRDVLRPTSPKHLTDELRAQFAKLHQEFTYAAAALAAGPPGLRESGLDVRVLGLASSFDTPPAVEWAGYRSSGSHQKRLFLSRLNAFKECCVIRGGCVDDFYQRADQGGAMLPVWANAPDDPLLHDAQSWLIRVKRRRELEDQQFVVGSPNGSAPHGVSIPTQEVVQEYWESTRPWPGQSCMVTDDRGNAERWLGFVFYMLKEYDPNAVEVQTFPAGRPCFGHDCNTMVSLRELDIYQASARAIVLAGWLHVPEVADTTLGDFTAAKGPTEALKGGKSIRTPKAALKPKSKPKKPSIPVAFQKPMNHWYNFTTEMEKNKQRATYEKFAVWLRTNHSFILDVEKFRAWRNDSYLPLLSRWKRQQTKSSD
jgi:hypothetical protein